MKHKHPQGPQQLFLPFVHMSFLQHALAGGMGDGSGYVHPLLQPNGWPNPPGLMQWPPAPAGGGGGEEPSDNDIDSDRGSVASDATHSTGHSYSANPFLQQPNKVTFAELDARASAPAEPPPAEARADVHVARAPGAAGCSLYADMRANASEEMQTQLDTGLAFAQKHATSLGIFSRVRFLGSGMSLAVIDSLNEIYGAETVGAKQMQRQFRFLMAMFPGFVPNTTSIRSTTFKYAFPELGTKAEAVHVACNNLQEVLRAALRDPLHTNWAENFTGDADHDVKLAAKLVGLTSEEHAKVKSGEPYLAPFSDKMNKHLREKYGELAKSLNATLLTLPILAYLDGVPPDAAMNMSVVVVYLQLLTRPYTIRMLPDSIIMYGTFSTIRVGSEEKTRTARSQTKRTALHACLDFCITEPFLEAYDTPFVMSDVAGAGDRTFLVCPYLHSFTSDHVMAVEMALVRAGACPQCVVEKPVQGTYFRYGQGQGAPALRTQATTILAVQEAQKWEDHRASGPNKGAITQARADIKTQRLIPETNALWPLSRMWPDYEPGIYGRIKTCDTLHWIDLGLYPMLHGWLMDKLKLGDRSLVQLHSNRVNAQPGFSNGLKLFPYFGGHIHLRTNGIPGSSWISLVILDLASLSTYASNVSGLLPSDQHAAVVHAIEQTIVYAKRVSRIEKNATDLGQLDACAAALIPALEGAFHDVLDETYGLKRPKIHQASHAIPNELADGGVQHFNCQGFEAANRFNITEAYAASMKKGNILSWLIGRFNESYFARTLVPILLDLPMRGLRGLGLAPAMVGTIYKTAKAEGSPLTPEHAAANSTFMKELKGYYDRNGLGDVPSSDFISVKPTAHVKTTNMDTKIWASNNYNVVRVCVCVGGGMGTPYLPLFLPTCTHSAV
jgi:hypothetical protein